MAGESTLSGQFSDLQEAVGFFLGWGSDSANWSAAQTATIDGIIQSGYRQFLFPPPLFEGGDSHQWSFLTPTASLSLLAATDPADYDLPDDFGGLKGGFYYSEGSLRNPIGIRPVSQILEDRARIDTTARPRVAGIRPKASFTGATAGTRYEVLFYPRPAANETVYYQYGVLLHKLASGAPYPAGGMQHYETLLESCLQVAESRHNDDISTHHDLLMVRLAASVSHDTDVMAPDTLGYNADYSDGRDYGSRGSEIVTVDGVSFP